MVQKTEGLYMECIVQAAMAMMAKVTVLSIRRCGDQKASTIALE